MKSQDIASYIDHTLLAANATEAKIDQLCKEALEHSFASVCVNSCWTARCAKNLKGANVKVCTVVGFPLGAMKTDSKAFEASQAISDGAGEIDMVLNVGWLKDGRLDDVRKDIEMVKEACQGHILKVILETCLLSDEEKVTACRLAMEGGADFVKTSTGFGPGGAPVHAVRLLKQVVGDHARVKAAGGIRTFPEARRLLEAGASRLGTRTAVEIIKDFQRIKVE